MPAHLESIVPATHPSLLIPPYRQVFPQLPKTDSLRFIPKQDSLDDVRRKRRQARNPPGIRTIDTDVPSEILHAGVLTRLDLLLPPVDFGGGLDERGLADSSGVATPQAPSWPCVCRADTW